MYSDDVTERMGVYKSEADVHPDSYLPDMAGRFHKREAWSEWAEAQDYSEYKQKMVARVERAWKAHMEGRGHHAFPSVRDVDDFLSERQQSVTMATVYKPYFIALRDFFEWLMWRTDYPHRYNPVLMACAEGEAGRELWTYYVEEVRRGLQEKKEDGTLE